MSGGGWREEAREVLASHEVSAGQARHPWGCSCGEAFRTSRQHAAHVADALLPNLAPVVAAEVARGKAAALREARDELTEIGQWKRLQGLAGVRDSCMAHARDHVLAVLLNRIEAIEAEAGER